MKGEEEKKRARRNLEKQLHQSKIDEIWPGGKDKGGKFSTPMLAFKVDGGVISTI